MASQRLDRLLQQCTVRLRVGSAQGTGFFVAPGLILTCAHVVEGAVGEAGFRPVDVFWRERNQHYIADIEEFLADPNIDLALLRLTVDFPDHPCVYLDASLPQLDDRLYTFGYPEDNPDGDPVTSGYEGESFRDNSSFHKLKGGQFNYGSSGSPLLNRRTGKVCGIVNISRDTTTDLGGRAVVAREILWKFPELIDRQRQFHRHNLRWTITALNVRQFILWQTIGGAVGAGVGLGSLRAAIAPFAYMLPSVQFITNFWGAALLGAALTLGMALSEQIEQPLRKGVSIWAVGLGTAFFGIAHMLLAFSNGSFLTETPLVAPMGFVAGLGLSIALYDQPWIRIAQAEAGISQEPLTNTVHLGINRCWLRFGLAALAFAAIQGVFILVG
ncbi:MAG: trypsin-like peptidase domain-containing protein, partial [Leptolyngbyaceae cyanobacterium RU_5_1]|nr:trypsin-like peptidase domain-containing protein [Leptolyngbyaceae cyanobacterium RU_5_1]